MRTFVRWVVVSLLLSVAAVLMAGFGTGSYSLRVKDAYGPKRHAATAPQADPHALWLAGLALIARKVMAIPREPGYPR